MYDKEKEAKEAEYLTWMATVCRLHAEALKLKD